MTSGLIINADDFGFSPGISDGIIDAHRRGVLTSTTLMTNMPDAVRAIRLARENPALGVGIHLGLTQGRPLTNNLMALVDEQGNFTRRLVPLLARVGLMGRVRRAVQIEWAAQIEFALNHGLVPTHLDSHKHIHHWPPLANIAIELAQKYHIRCIRCAREAAIAGEAGGLGYTVLTGLANRLYPQIVAGGLQTSDWFYGLKATGRMSTPRWLTLLKQLPTGIGEVMVHPGNPTGLNAADTRLLAERTLEFNALCDPAVKNAALDRGVKLMHFGNLTDR